MTQSDFNASLRQLADQHTPAALHEPAYIAQQLLRRDRRRTRLLAAASALLWLAGIAGLVLLVIGLNRFIIGVRIEHLQPWNASPPTADTTLPSQQERFLLEETNLLHHSMPYVAGSLAALMLAGLFTLMLIFTSRQATLNQINLSLAKLADELAQRQGEASSGTMGR